MCACYYSFSCWLVTPTSIHLSQGKPMLPSVISHSYMEGSTQDSSKNGKNHKGPKEAREVLLANYTVGIEIHVLPLLSNSESSNKRKEGRKRRWKGDQIAEERRFVVLDPGSIQPTGYPGPGGHITKALRGYLVMGKFSPPGFRFLALHVNESAGVLWTCMEMGGALRVFWWSWSPSTGLACSHSSCACIGLCCVVFMDQNRKICPRKVLPCLCTSLLFSHILF